MVMDTLLYKNKRHYTSPCLYGQYLEETGRLTQSGKSNQATHTAESLSSPTSDFPLPCF